jgi:hypothetical protein
MKPFVKTEYEFIRRYIAAMSTSEDVRREIRLLSSTLLSFLNSTSLVYVNEVLEGIQFVLS